MSLARHPGTPPRQHGVLAASSETPDISVLLVQNPGSCLRQNMFRKRNLVTLDSVVSSLNVQLSDLDERVIVRYNPQPPVVSQQPR